MPLKSRSRSNHRRQLLKRQGKSKFSEGEVVLCYEPDPAKTKVLYSSKVIQIVEKYDDNDKRYEEYLIHFHGWNSTWDRYVTEDYILKDTPENRKLQQELANEAQLTPGGNLYKRDLRGRRRSSNSRRRSRNSENVSQSNVQQSNDEEAVSQGDVTQDEYSSDKSSDDEGMNVSFKELLPCPTISIPAVLKRALGYDEYLVTKKKLLRIPSEPTIITILESFVHHYVTHGLRTYISKQTRRLKYDDLATRVSLCKEVMDGLRVIFDFTVGNLLLYQEEKNQFFECHNISVKPPVRSTTWNPENDCKEFDISSAHEVKMETFPSYNEGVKSPVVIKRILRSQHHQQGGEFQESPYQNIDKFDNQIKYESVTPSKKEEIQNSIASSSCSSNGIAPPYNFNFDGSIIYNRHIKKLIQKEMGEWKLVPDHIYSEKPLKPSLIYGATHLTRLFVKLPEILQYSLQKCDITEIVTDYSESLLNYLAEHPEWFGNSHYEIADLA